MPALVVAVTDDPCARHCLGRTCAELRSPPRGIAPLQCTTSRFLGCDCDRCCHEAPHTSSHAAHLTESYGALMGSPAPPIASNCKAADDGGNVTRGCADFCSARFHLLHCPVRRLDSNSRGQHTPLPLMLACSLARPPRVFDSRCCSFAPVQRVSGACTPMPCKHDSV